jgi:hypothetical protein
MIDSQSKRDLTAGGAILLMFVGAFILPVSSLGLLPIIVGAFVILFLILKVLLQHR